MEEGGKGDPIPLSVWERLELRLASASLLVPQMLEYIPLEDLSQRCCRAKTLAPDHTGLFIQL